MRAPPSPRPIAAVAAAAISAATALAIAPATASARIVHDEPYGVEQTWTAAVRLLRVDMGFTITERDRDSGFLLFEYRDAGRTAPGSLEVLPAQVEGVRGSRVIVQIAQMPTYVEHHIATRLGRKLREEYGVPQRPPAREPEQRPPADGGAGDASSAAVSVRATRRRDRAG